MNIELNISKSKFIPKLYPTLNDYSHRFEVYMGSAGSGKSYYITQKLILKALKEKRRVIVARRYGSTLRNSVFALFKIVLNDFKLTSYCKIRETDFYIQLPNGSEFIFLGLDDENKLLSLANISDVFLEEATEASKDILEQLNLRMRGTAANQQIFIAFNPISKKNYLYNFCEVTPPKSLLYNHSTYKDNPFLSKAYTDSLDELYILNPAKARIYCDGEWGVAPEGLVYTNWKIEEFNPQELAAKGFPHKVGMDMGFIDPSTVVCSLYAEKERTIYVYQDWYKRGAQLDEIQVALSELKLQKTLIYCDSADPRAIDYFRNNGGFKVEGAKKGAGSVDTGIAFLQTHKLIIHPNCKNVINELENYSYLKDKQTGAYVNKTDHEFSHTLDALRYSYSDIYTSTKLKTMNKSVLGF